LSPFCVSFNGINIELLTLVFGSHYKQILNTHRCRGGKFHGCAE
jgi:hypothetical protein